MSWAIWIIRGIAGITFGILALVMPAASIAALVLTFGVYAVIDGLVMIGLAFGERPTRWPYIVRGLVGIAAGVVTFVAPGLTALSLYLLIGAWALASGIVEIVTAFAARRQLPHFGGSVLTGVLMAAFGAVMLALPAIGVSAVIGFIAAYAIMNGITSIGIGMRIHDLVPSHQAHAAA